MLQTHRGKFRSINVGLVNFDLVNFGLVKCCIIITAYNFYRILKRFKFSELTGLRQFIIGASDGAVFGG